MAAARTLEVIDNVGLEAAVSARWDNIREVWRQRRRRVWASQYYSR